MALYLVLLCTILAFPLASTEQNASSPGSSIDLSLHSMKNTSGNWNITVDTRKENPRPLSVNVHQQTNNKTEQLAYPSLHDTSMSGAVQPTTTTTTPKSCPHPGYHLYPNFNCYKAFPSRSERRTWSEARDQCVRDGGDLMVMETERERQDVFKRLVNSVYFSFYPWVGVNIPEGEDGWMTVNGEPVPITWWCINEPDGNAARKCAAADTSGLLRNYNCTYTAPFICEISV